MSEEEKPKKDQVNELIQKLLTMIPEEFFHDYVKKKEHKDETSSIAAAAATGSTSSSAPGSVPTSTPTSASIATTSTRNKGTGTRDGKPNKGQILTQAVEYVNFLQEQVDTRNREEVELILKVKALCQQTGSIVNDINLDNTSAEVALARIGVGPLAGVMLDERQSQQHSQSNSASQRGGSRRYHFEYGGYGEYGDGS